MKAILQQQGIRFEKIHDLLALVKLCLPIAPQLELHKELFAFLNQFSVAYRYSGETATRDQAKQAVHALKKLRAMLREMLDLDR